MKFTSLISEIQHLLEQSRYEVLVDKFSKVKKKASGKTIKPKISLETLRALMLADPTTRPGEETDIDTGDIKKVGAYSQWLIKQWMSLQQKADKDFEYGTQEWKDNLKRLQDLFLEDLYKTTEDLQKFNRFKSQIPQEKRDINRIASVDELYDLTKGFSLEDVSVTKSEAKEKRKREEVDYLYDGERWEVVVPKTKEVSCDMAGDPLTRWCTASSNMSYYERYAPQGPLYILRDKNEIVKEGRGAGEPRPRYQFHFPSNQFMDQDDRSVNLEQFLSAGEGKELKEFFKHEFAKALNKDFADKVQVNYPNDQVSRFITLYGFDEFFDKLPKSLKRFDFEMGRRGYGTESEEVPSFDISRKLLDFTQLEVLHIENILKSLPDDIDRLKNLKFISLPNNPNLTTIPSSVANLPRLEVINVRGAKEGFIVPPEVQERIDSGDLILVE